MVIEYIGSIIRNEVANKRERIYESQVNYYTVDPKGVIIESVFRGIC